MSTLHWLWDRRESNGQCTRLYWAATTCTRRWRQRVRRLLRVWTWGEIVEALEGLSGHAAGGGAGVERVDDYRRRI